MTSLNAVHEQRAENIFSLAGKLRSRELPCISRFQRVGCILSIYFEMEKTGRSDITDDDYVIRVLVEACDIAKGTASKIVRCTGGIAECFRLAWNCMSFEDQAISMGMDYSHECNFWPFFDVYSNTLYKHLVSSSQTQSSFIPEDTDVLVSLNARRLVGADPGCLPTPFDPKYVPRFVEEVYVRLYHSEYTSRFQRIGAILDMFDKYASAGSDQWVFDALEAVRMLASLKIKRRFAEHFIASQDWAFRFRLVWALIDDNERAEAITEVFDELHNYWPGFAYYNKTLSKHIALTSGDPYTLLRCPPGMAGY